MSVLLAQITAYPSRGGQDPEIAFRILAMATMILLVANILHFSSTLKMRRTPKL